MDAGSQAEAFTAIRAGRTITHINDEDISDLTIIGIKSLISKTQDSTTFTFASDDATDEPSAPFPDGSPDRPTAIAVKFRSSTTDVLLSQQREQTAEWVSPSSNPGLGVQTPLDSARKALKFTSEEPIEEQNDAGHNVALGDDSTYPGHIGSDKFYCGQTAAECSLPGSDGPGSDGHCGPNAGPQCKSCLRFQSKFALDAVDSAQGWLHNDMSKEEATQLVAGKPNGTFFVRPRAKGGFALTVVYQARATFHHLKCPAEGNASVGKAELPVSGLSNAVAHLRAAQNYWPAPLKGHIPNSLATENVIVGAQKLALFRLINKHDGDNILDHAELEDALRNQGFLDFVAEIGVDLKQTTDMADSARRVFKCLDKNDSGDDTMNEFMQGLEKLARGLISVQASTSSTYGQVSKPHTPSLPFFEMSIAI